MSQYSENRFYESDNHAWGIIFKYIKSNSKILDIGCSSGNLGEVLIEEKNCIVDGIEPFHEDAQKASRKLRNVYELNIETDKITELTEKYDYVIFADVIEHLVDPMSALKKIRKLLKPNGAVIYSIPNMAHISIRLALLEGQFDHTETGLIDKTHLHFYTGEQIRRTFEGAGYNVTDQKYTYVVYPKQYLVNRFKQAGLKLTTTAINKLTHEVGAQAFQYIGIAQPNSKLKYQPINVLPHQKDSQQINDMIAQKEKDISLLSAELNKIQQLNAEKQNHIDILNAENARIAHRAVRKGYRFLDAARKRRRRL